MQCAGIILLEIIVIAVNIVYKLITLACSLTMEVMGNYQVTIYVDDNVVYAIEKEIISNCKCNKEI